MKVSARALAYSTFLGSSPGTTCLLHCTAGRELLSGTQKVSDPSRGMEGLGKDKGRPKGRARAPTVAVTGSGGGRRRSAPVAASGGEPIAVYSTRVAYSSAMQQGKVWHSAVYGRDNGAT